MQNFLAFIPCPTRSCCCIPGARQLQTAGGKKAAEVEFHVPFWSEEEDFSVSQPLGQHSQYSQSLLLMAQFANPHSQTKPAAPPATFAPSPFLTHIFCRIRVIFFFFSPSLPRPSSVSPTPLSALNFPKPRLSPALASATPSLLPRLPEAAGLIHSSRKESSSKKQQCPHLPPNSARPGGCLVGMEAETGGGS